MVDTESLCLAGFSMGAGGALLAAEDLGPVIKNFISLCHWKLDIPEQLAFDAPTLFLTGTDDSVALPSRVLMIYKAHPEMSDKMFVNIKGLVHTDIENPGAYHAIISTYVIAWLQYYVARQPAYLDYLTGRVDPFIPAALAEFAYQVSLSSLVYLMRLDT
jgi:alpha-beta hydrolase superfamily lysophospholipase